MGTVDWWPFIFGCIVGIIPWMGLSTSLGLAQTGCLENAANGTFTVFTTTTAAMTTSPANSTTMPMGPTGDCIPSFVFGVFASLLILFFTFALNMLLQYARAGPWKRPYFSECIYLWLSLIAKSILAWQIYAGSGV